MTDRTASVRTGTVRRRVGVLVAGFAAWLLIVSPALAATLTYIVPFAAGGESDVTARLQELELETLTGKHVVIQYLPGAGGARAWASLNSQKADGSVVMGVNLPTIFLQPMERDVGYKTKDLVLVSIFQLTPDALIVPADSPFKTLGDLIAAAKKNPGAITLSGSGTYTGPQLATTAFDKLAGIKTTYIPFAGTAPAVIAMLGKQVNAAMTFTTVAAQQGSKVRVLAVALDKRAEELPNVPTFRELGINLVSGVYRGIAVPKATPIAKRKELSALFTKVNENPEYRKKMVADGFQVLNIDYQHISAFLAQKKKEYEAAARDVGLLK